MTTTKNFRSTRLAATAGLALAAALTLAACGGEDDDETTPEEATSEVAPEETGSDDAGTGAGTESDAAGAESGSDAPGPVEGAPAEVELTVPEGWSDATQLLTEGTDFALPDGVDLQIYTSAAGTENITLTMYPNDYVGGGSYLDMLGASGADTSLFTEGEEREIGGYTVTSLETTQDAGTGTVLMQRAYGIPLGNGGLVEIVLTANEGDFEAAGTDFDTALDSIVITES